MKVGNWVARAAIVVIASGENIMAYLRNSTINCLNIQGALMGLLDQATLVFAPIYFYTQGFTLPEVFVLLAVLNVARLPLRLLSFPIVRRLGLRAALMVSAAGSCLSFPMLNLVKGCGGWLVAFVFVFALFSALYWHCYHTFYSMAGEKEHRGRHLSVALSLGTAVSALAPILSGFLIAKTGFQKYFLLPIPLMLLMLAVLSRSRDVPVHRVPWREGRTLMFNLGARIHVAEASVLFPLSVGWTFVVYLFTGGRMAEFGGIVTFGLVIQILYQLWLGHIVDRGAGRSVAHVAGGLRLVQAVGMAMCPLSLPRILALQTLSGATNVHHGLALTTTMYNAGKGSHDPFWYWLFAESAFDFGTILGAGAVALLLYLGVPVQLTLLLSLPGIAAVWWLTHRYFPKTAATVALGAHPAGKLDT